MKPSRERIEEIRAYVPRHYHTERVQMFNDLLAYIDELEAELEILKNPSDGRCMEIGALREANAKLKAENKKMKTIPVAVPYVTEEKYWKIAEVNGDLIEKNQKLHEEIEKLKRILAKELSENDELGCEYTYVITLKEENQKLRERVKLLREALEEISLGGTPYWLGDIATRDVYEFARLVKAKDDELEKK